MTLRTVLTSKRVRQMATGAVLGSGLVIGAYAVSPLVTLWSMASALQHDDVPTLRAALDWRTVRSGIKADLDGGLPIRLASTSQSVAPSQDELPDFGSSFATTIVSHVVDDVMTPEHLASMLSRHGPGHGMTLAAAFGRIQHLGFTGPQEFQAAIRLSEDTTAPPVLVTMRVEKWQWKVTRIHLPEQVLNGSGADRT